MQFFVTIAALAAVSSAAAIDARGKKSGGQCSGGIQVCKTESYCKASVSCPSISETNCCHTSSTATGGLLDLPLNVLTCTNILSGNTITIPISVLSS